MQHLVKASAPSSAGRLAGGDGSRLPKRLMAALATLTIVTACGGGATTAPTAPPATAVPATAVAATAVPATAVPATAVAPTAAAGGGSVTVGSYHSDKTEKAGMDAINTAFTAANGDAVKMNTVDHNTFQDQITSYLGGTPDDDFTWFSGYRMRFFAAQNLVNPIDNVWNQVKSNYTDAFATAVTGDDGHVYGIPVDYYPWAVFYRKSVFAAHGYTVPKTWADLTALMTKMQSDGLIPFAFGDKDGWPAMGTFDILDLRLNGYQFHVDLLTGKEKWTDPRVTAVFNQWKQLVPFQDTAQAGLTWEQSADKVVQKTAGMYLLGLFLTSEFTNPADLADLDFFPFPTLGTQYDAENALDAPIDVVMQSKKSPTLTADQATADAWLQFYAKGSTQKLLFDQSPGFIPAASDADTSAYSALQTKAVQLVSSAGKITQFLDRDSRPDFAGANGMQTFLQTFLQNPNQDLNALQTTIQKFWDQLPPAS